MDPTMMGGMPPEMMGGGMPMGAPPVPGMEGQNFGQMSGVSPDQIPPELLMALLQQMQMQGQQPQGMDQIPPELLMQMTEQPGGVDPGMNQLMQMLMMLQQQGGGMPQPGMMQPAPVGPGPQPSMSPPTLGY